VSDALARAVARVVDKLTPGMYVVVLAGPGVLASNAVDGLRLLAATAGIGVVNTWGAKGVFAWDDPHHLGTAGLQQLDFELAGLGDADLVLATGVDSKEAPGHRWQHLAPSLVVPPRALAPLAEAWPLDPGTPERPPLYIRLAEVVQPLYADERVPLSPARAVADVKACLPPGAVVHADPGPAGLWVARTFPTSELGSVRVPAVAEPGGAMWAGVNTASRGRPTVVITHGPLDLDSDEGLAYAAASGIPLVVEVWGQGHLSEAAVHRRLLAGALAEARDAGRVQVIEVPVDWSDTLLLEEVAGPVVAWEAS
jgi:thiamine pyrophosphate-dependent acetolactate synthase large subunit-like protein